MVRLGLLFDGVVPVGEVGGNLKALFIVPVLLRAALSERPDGVVGESSPSSSSSSSVVVVFRLVDVPPGMTVTVGSAEFGSEPSGTKGIIVPGGVVDGFRGRDFVGANGGGAADDWR